MTDTCRHCGKRIVKMNYTLGSQWTHQQAGAAFQDGVHEYCHLTRAETGPRPAQCPHCGCGSAHPAMPTLLGPTAKCGGWAVMTTAADWIKTRRELLAAATPGPWELICGGEYVDGVGLDVGHLDGGVRACDAELIADARTSLPLVLDALEAVLAVLPEPGSVDMYGVAGALSLDVRDAIETALGGES